MKPGDQVQLQRVKGLGTRKKKNKTMKKMIKKKKGAILLVLVPFDCYKKKKVKEIKKLYKG
jgi:hypothetical protein